MDGADSTSRDPLFKEEDSGPLHKRKRTIRQLSTTGDGEKGTIICEGGVIVAPSGGKKKRGKGDYV